MKFRRRRPADPLEITVGLEDERLWTVRLKGLEHYDHLAEFYHQDLAEQMATVLRQLCVTEVEDGFDIERFAEDLAMAIETHRWIEQLGLKW